jgi:hypothetical protein
MKINENDLVTDEQGADTPRKSQEEKEEQG